MAAQPPPRQDDRVILHFDYDCFYAQVVQNRSPAARAALAGRPVGVTQKTILATCNYEARRRGVKKLMRISDARRVCPDLVLVDGEDLSPFRDASKALCRVVAAAVGRTAPVERLGLDEVFVDATRLVEANLARVRALEDRAQAFFTLPDEEQGGFRFDARSIAGAVTGADDSDDDDSDDDPDAALPLILGSHLAAHLRRLLLADHGYTASAGIATNKALAKLAGGVHKPDAQTTVLSTGRGGDERVLAFVDALPLRRVPGIGAKTSALLGAHVRSDGTTARHDDSAGEATVLVGDVRRFPGLSPAVLDAILSSDALAAPNLPSGDRVWALLHGVDTAPVVRASAVPTQISIEDTYGGSPARRALLPPTAVTAVAAELRKLGLSLLQRMRVDLAADGSSNSNNNNNTVWVARPRTLRLTMRPQWSDMTGVPYGFARASRSGSLPGFVRAAPAERSEQMVARLVDGHLVPMFRQLAAAVRDIHGRADSRWTVGMLNVCVANMAPVAGRDSIEAMFDRQAHDDDDDDEDEDNDDGDDDEDDNGWADAEPCRQCGRPLPPFARAAHARFHLLGDG